MVIRGRFVVTMATALVLALSLVGLTGCKEEPVVETAPVVESTEPASPLDVFDGLEGTIDIAGGTAHVPVMEAVAGEIMAAHDDISITIAGGGSGVGVQQVGEGLVDIGNAGREPKDEEMAKYPDLIKYAWAIDGVTAIVNPENSVQNLTSEQLQKIFAGEITDWSEVGGEAGAINVFAREEGSGTGETFIDQGLDGGDVTAQATIVSSNGAMKTAIGAG